DKCTHDGTLFNSDSVHALDTSLANSLSFFYLITPRPPTSTLFPYTTLFRSISGGHAGHRNYVVCGCAVGNDNVQVRRAAVRRHRSEEHTSELQSRGHLVCRLLLEKKNRHVSGRSIPPSVHTAETHRDALPGP